MTEVQTYQQRRQQLLAEAVRALTDAARLTYTVGEGDQRREEQADFAEFVTLAVAGAAANIGSIEQLLAGRPGSWEADYVRQMLVSTVGADENYLLEHRTEPITVVVNVDDLLNELGVWELYQEAEDELNRREETIAPFPTPDPTTQRTTRGPFTDEQEAALDALAELSGRLDEQRQREWTAYGEAFQANVQRAAAQLLPNLGVPVEVVVELTWQNSLGSGESLGPDWRLWDWARNETALPGAGIPLKDYPADVPLAQVERDAGRRPLDRLERPKQS